VSGCDIATHVIGGIRVQDEARVAVIDRNQFSIVDDWHVIGMRGTGSRRVVVKDAFVPTFRTILPPRDAFNSSHAPGRRVHSNPMYEHELCASRLSIPPFSLRSEVPEYQRHFGDAWALIQVAAATVLKVADDYMEFARQAVEEDIPFSDERDVQLQLLEQYATKIAGDAVDLMFRTSGTHAAQSDSMLQRYFRDMAVVKTHIAAQTDRGAESFGRAHFTGSGLASTGGV
jgi:3-hydroxy-9,10-secoandrosta-1,3,5(10)-triene-9,17-dione monooxygenase